MDPVLYSWSLIGFGWRKLKRKFNVNQRMQNRIWNQRRIYGHHQTGRQNKGGGPPKTHFVYFSNGCLPPPAQQGASGWVLVQCGMLLEIGRQNRTGGRMAPSCVRILTVLESHTADNPNGINTFFC